MAILTKPLRRVAGAAALAILCAFSASAALAAQDGDVRVRFGRHKDFVRFVFDWKERTAYAVELQPSGAILRFKAENDFDMSRVKSGKGLQAEQLGAGAAKVGYSGAQSIKHWRLGERVVVDLYMNGKGEALPSADAAPPAKPPQQARRSEDAAPPKSPQASAQTAGRAQAEPTQAAAEPKPAPEPAPEPAAEQKVAKAADDAPAKPDMPNPVPDEPGAKADMAEAAAPEPLDEAQGSPAMTGETGEAAPSPAVVETAAAMQTEPAETQPGDASASPDGGTAARTMPPAARLADIGDEAKTETAAGDLPTDAADPTATSATETPDPVAAMAAVAPPSDGPMIDPTRLNNAAPEPSPSAATTAAATTAAAAPAFGGPPALESIAPPELAAAPKQRAEVEGPKNVRMNVQIRSDRVILGLSALESRAAAFTRAGSHWIVLDQPLNVSLSTANAAGVDIVQLPFLDKTVLHVRAETEGRLIGWRNDLGWRFAFSGEPDGEVAPIQATRRLADRESARMVLEGLGDSKLLQVNDPEVGDALFVVAVKDPIRVEALLESPDVKVLPTALGAVIEPRTEGVGARLKGPRLDIGKRGGLQLSDPDRILLAGSDTRGSFVDPARWRGEERTYLGGMLARLAKMNGVAAFGRNGTRMDLARYALARGFAAEAIGYLQSIDQSDQGAAAKAEFRAIRGIARAMLGQHDLAAADLSDPSLAGDPHVEVWLALGLADDQSNRFASAKFRRFWSAVAEWPKRHRVRLTVAAGETSLAAGLPDVAERFLHSDIDPGGALRRKDVAALAVVEGGVRAARGDMEGAKAAYELARRDGDRLTQAKGELQLIKLQSASGEITSEEATDRLARLQFRWRGDRVEYETLKALGEIQLANSKFQEGFRALSEAAHVFAARYDVTDVRAAITAGFEQAFVGAGAEKLTAFEAVALFEDFEDYAPAGSSGDLALASLARRLASLDLVHEADEIMDHLVRRRLTGALQLQVALELAALRLSERDWRGALLTLDQFDPADAAFTSALRGRYRLHRAQALSGLGRVQEAMALLDDEDDRPSLEMRAKMAWSSADWVSARDAYRKLDAMGAFNNVRLSRNEAAMTVRWAVSATMLKNSEETERVANRFQDRIDDASLASALAALGSPVATSGEALSAARDAIANVDAVANAVKDYQAAREG